MKLRKKDGIFIFLSVLILVAAVVFVFVGARASGPEITYHEFTIPITYEQYGEVKTQTVTYCVDYWEEEQSFSGYYEDNGMPDEIRLAGIETGEEWWVEFGLEGGYLMGDPAYTDFYADGMPEPTLGYFDEDWNEHHGVMEVERYGVKLIGCGYPEPIENQIVDKGVKLDHKAIGVLMALAFVILLLSIILVKKEEGVVYHSRDKAARVLNLAVAVSVLPLMFALGDGWDLLPAQSIDNLLAALMAPITVLSICASVILRRKGKSLPGMVVQFVGLVVFLYLIAANVLIAFGPYLLFLVAGVAIGILIAVRSKRNADVVPTALDRVSLVTNVALIPIYSILSVILLFMAAITDTGYGFEGPLYESLAFICSCVIAAGPIYCGLALGMSVALRRKGKSLAGFLVQFAGFGGILIFILIGLLPCISVSIN